MSKELALVDRARKALAEAQSIQEVGDVRDKARALADYLKTKAGCEESARRANEIRIRAERRIGEISKELPTKPGERTDRRPSPCPGGGKEAALKGAGIHPNRAREYQQLADIPEATFEQEVTKPDASTAKLVRIARSATRPKAKKARPRHANPGDIKWSISVARAASIRANKYPADSAQRKGLERLAEQARYLSTVLKEAK